MLRTERKTQQLSRLADPVESCATSVSQSVQQKFWTDGLKSQEAAEYNFVARRSPARNRDRFNLKRLRSSAGRMEIGPIVLLRPDLLRPSTSLFRGYLSWMPSTWASEAIGLMPLWSSRSPLSSRCRRESRGCRGASVLVDIGRFPFS